MRDRLSFPTTEYQQPFPQAGEAPPSTRAVAGSEPHAAGLVVAITTLAALVRVLHLGAKSLWLDEAASWMIVHQPWDAFVRQLLTAEGNMTLYYLLLRQWLRFGESEAWMRALSVLPAVATVPLVYALARRVWDVRAGVLAALLLALNACHVAYSQEARSYAWLAFATVVSTWYFLAGIDRPSFAGWTAYAWSTAAIVYFQFLGGLVPLAQWLSLAVLRREQIPGKHLLYGLGVLAALVAPAAWYVITRDQGQINWVPRPSLLEVYHVLTFLASNGRKGLCNFLLLAYAAGLSLAIRAFCLALRRCGRTLANWHQALILCGFAGPIAISLVLSVWKVIFFKRFLFVCLPSLVMLVAAGIAQVRSPRLLAVAVMYAAVCSAGTVWYWYGRPNEPWRDAAGYVYGEAHAGDVLVFHKPWSGHAAFDYYRGRMQHLPGARSIVVQPVPNVLHPDPWSSPRVWLALFHSSWGRSPDAGTLALRASLQRAYGSMERRRFQNIEVDLFSRPREGGGR